MNRSNTNKLKDIFYSLSSPAAYAGINSVYNEAKKHIQNISRDQVEEFLQSQSAYTLYKPGRKKFKRLRTVPSGLNTDWQADLAILDTLHKNNDGYKYLLVCIDVLSRKIYATGVKSKSPRHMVEGFDKIFEKAKTRPLKLYTDRGIEFQAKAMLKYYEDLDIIKHVVYSPDIHAGVVERSHKTIKGRLYKYFHNKKTHRWIDVIDKIVDGINNTINRGIGVRPNDINYKNSQEHRERVFGSAYNSDKKPKFKVGDLIRINKDKGVFGKGYHPNYTLEIFKIKAVKYTDPPHYKITDLKGEDILGVFYEPEISHVRENRSDQKGSGIKFQPVIWSKL
jgi:transposase InsO family protein